MSARRIAPTSNMNRSRKQPPADPTIICLIKGERKPSRASILGLEPPPLEYNIHRYTDSRIQKGIDYVERRLEYQAHKASPNLSKLLVVYKSACADYLNQSNIGFKDESKEALLSEIREYEDIMSRDPRFKIIEDNNALQYQSGLLNLRLHQYLTRYGGYMQRLAHELLVTSGVQQIENWELVSLYDWPKISKKIHAEESRWKKYGSAMEMNATESTYDVWKTCQAIGADFDQMIAAIHTYGGRNPALDNNVLASIANGDWSRIAETISKDLDDLSGILPMASVLEEALMRATLLELRDRWFRTGAETTPPTCWFPTETLYQEHLSCKNPGDRQAAQLLHQEDVACGAKSRLEKMGMVEELVAQLSAAGTLPP